MESWIYSWCLSLGMEKIALKESLERRIEANCKEDKECL